MTLQAALDEAVAGQALPGAVAAVAYPDGRIDVVASGFADKELALPMRPNATLLSASIGKNMVVALSLMLVAERALALDATIATWLGDEPWFDRLPNAHAITLRELLEHSSGIPDHIYEPECAAWRAQRMHVPDVILTPLEMIGFVLDKPALFAPGAGFSYSDTAYILAGLILERVSGLEYYRLLRERILEPFQLTQTSPSNHRDIAGLASGYLTEGGAFGRPPGWPVKVVIDGQMIFNPASEWTGGGLATNPHDLSLWAKTFYEGHALSTPYLPDLLRPNADIEAAKKRVGGAYALGTIVRATDFGPAYGHTGGMPGYSGSMMYFAEQRLAMSLQVNQTSCNLWQAEALLMKAALASA